LLAEELIKIYSNGVGLEIWKQLNSFFSNLTSAELAIVSIQKLISNNERAITEATESKRESFTNPILHFLEFADLYLVISSDLVDARDSSMAPYKKLEVNVLAAAVWNDTLLLIATPKGELKIFNRELKEMRAIDLDGLRVS
jgi:hypothetical protein